MTRWQERLENIKQNKQEKPTIVEIMRLPGVKDWRKGYIYTEWNIDKDFFSIGGSLFGGYVCALADQVACHCGISILEDNETLRTVNLSTTFFKRIDAGVLKVEANVVSASKSIIAVEVQFKVGQGDLAAKAEAILYRIRVSES